MVKGLAMCGRKSQHSAKRFDHRVKKQRAGNVDIHFIVTRFQRISRKTNRPFHPKICQITLFLQDSEYSPFLYLVIHQRGLTFTAFKRNEVSNLQSSCRLLQQIPGLQNCRIHRGPHRFRSLSSGSI